MLEQHKGKRKTTTGLHIKCPRSDCQVKFSEYEVKVRLILLSDSHGHGQSFCLHPSYEALDVCRLGVPRYRSTMRLDYLTGWRETQWMSS